MYLLMEAMLAGSILVLIVWWTMFQGRQKGEKKEPEKNATPDNKIQ